MTEEKVSLEEYQLAKGDQKKNKAHSSHGDANQNTESSKGKKGNYTKEYP